MNKNCKKIATISFIGASLAACAPKVENNEPVLCDYKEIYDGTSKEKHVKITKPQDINRASYGYRFNDEQGYNDWFFLTKNDSGIENLVKVDEKWTSTKGSYLNDDGEIFTTQNEAIVVVKKIINKGKYIFSGTLKSTKENSFGKVEVYLNDVKVEIDETLNEVRDDEIGYYIEGIVDAMPGDQLSFVLRGENIYFNPAIKIGEKFNDSLYNTHNDWGYYGDIHCYYHDNKLHLYHLWNFTGNDSGWKWFMQDTTDMFRFQDAGFDDSFIKDHYMSYGKAPNVFTEDYIDSRDRTYFYDPEVKRYRSIGLCYKEKGNNISTDLALRTSDDELGLSWTSKSVALRSFPTTKDGEPECSQIFKIGNRWYLASGVSGQSRHQIGTCNYWIGDENATIDEVDWQSKETHYLDGEDICVPQVEKVKDRHYLFGWMTTLYDGFHWGGVKNLPREVFQRPDGTLGTRIDEEATRLLNKGKLINLTAPKNQISQLTDGKILIGNNATKINNTIESAFIKFDVDMKKANNLSLILFEPNSSKEYYLSIKNDGENMQLEVSDNTGYVFSKVNLPKDANNKYSVKAVVEGPIVEFGVNDQIVLSARTSMNSDKFSIGFKSNETTEISNLSINKLAQYFDVYD